MTDSNPGAASHDNSAWTCQPVRKRFPTRRRPVSGSDFFARTDGARGSAVAEWPAAQRFPAMGLSHQPGPAPQAQSGWVDVLMHDVIVLLDLHEVDRVTEPRGLEQVPRIPQRAGISLASAGCT